MITKPRSSFPLIFFADSPYWSTNVEAAVCSIMTQKQPELNNTEAAEHPIILNSVESMVNSLQHKREKYATKGLSKENSQWKEVNKTLYYKELLYIPKDDRL